MSIVADPSWWGWDWIERASWLAALGALFTTLYQVKALRKELTEKPNLQAGFGVGIQPCTTFRLDRDVILPSRSKAVPFDIHIVNTGKKSARDILLNVLFDSAIESEHAKRSIRSIDGRYFKPEQPSGTSIIVRHIRHIHPDDYRIAELAWHFPFEPAEYDVLIEASAADVKTMSVRLKLRVTTDPEVRRVLLGR